MPDKLLIVGLGNPGKHYADTRHNIGFRLVDELAAREREVFRAGRGEYLLCRLKLAEKDVLLQKPLTYMNLSGSAVLHVLNYFKMSADALLVVADDINLPFGKLRFRSEGSDGGHNGLSSVIATLGTQEFARLRIGVGNEYVRGEQADFVLSAFNTEERGQLNDIIGQAVDGVMTFVEHGIDEVMNRFN